MPLKNQPETHDLCALDEFEGRLLEALIANARISNAKLAKAVHLSQSQTLRRMRQLQDERKILIGFAPILNLRELGFRLTVFVNVRLRRQAKVRLDSFEEAIKNEKRVLDCYLMSGAADYMLRVVARDVEDFERVLQRITQLPAVSRITSSVAYRVVKQAEPPPLRELVRSSGGPLRRSAKRSG